MLLDLTAHLPAGFVVLEIAALFLHACRAKMVRMGPGTVG